MKCICGKDFEVKRKTAKYCSTKCRVYASRSVTDSVTDGVTTCSWCYAKDLEITRLKAEVLRLYEQRNPPPQEAPRFKPLGVGYKPNSLYGA